MIEIVLGCDVDGCEVSLRLEWTQGDYVSLIDPAKFSRGDGYLTLDGSAAVPMSATGWRVEDVNRHRHTVRCPIHAVP